MRVQNICTEYLENPNKIKCHEIIVNAKFVIKQTRTLSPTGPSLTTWYCAPTVPGPRFIVWFSPAVFIWAVIFGHYLRASVTFHRAAPVKLAVAATDDLDALFHHSEAAFIAQPAAALPLPLGHTLVTLQALPPLRAMKFQALVFHAVIRRILQINELCPRDAPEGLRDGPSVVCAVSIPHGPLVHLQLLCMVIFHFQIVADLSEISQLHPAGLDAAAARYSVTLTRSSHGGLDCLSQKREC